jgi:hypothetical protein
VALIQCEQQTINVECDITERKAGVKSARIVRCNEIGDNAGGVGERVKVNIKNVDHTRDGSNAVQNEEFATHSSKRNIFEDFDRTKAGFVSTEKNNGIFPGPNR